MRALVLVPLGVVLTFVSASAEPGMIIQQERHTSGSGQAVTTKITYYLTENRMRIDSQPEGTDFSSTWLLSEKGAFLCLKEPSYSPPPAPGQAPGKPVPTKNGGICEKMAHFDGVSGASGAAGTGVKARVKKFTATPTGKSKVVLGQKCRVYQTSTESSATVDIGGMVASSETKLSSTSCVSEAIDVKRVLALLPAVPANELLSTYVDAKTAQSMRDYHQQGIELEGSGQAHAISSVLNQKFETTLSEGISTKSIRPGDIALSTFDIPKGYKIGKLSGLRALAAAREAAKGKVPNSGTEPKPRR